MLDDLAGIYASLERLENSDDEHVRTIAALARATLEGHPAEEVLKDALGIERRPGSRRITTAIRHTKRDQLLREAATRFVPARPVAEQARELYRALVRYAGSAWKQERRVRSCPARHRDRIEEFCWHILKVKDQAVGIDRIRKVLSGGYS